MLFSSLKRINCWIELSVESWRNLSRVREPTFLAIRVLQREFWLSIKKNTLATPSNFKSYLSFRAKFCGSFKTSVLFLIRPNCLDVLFLSGLLCTRKSSTSKNIFTENLLFGFIEIFKYAITFKNYFFIFTSMRSTIKLLSESFKKVH